MLRLFILLFLLATCSCSIRSAPRYTADSKVERELKERRRASPNRLARVVEGYLGVPYKWGGTTRAGMDCSAFVRTIFRKTYGIELPLTTRPNIPRRPPRQPTAGTSKQGIWFFLRLPSQGRAFSHVENLPRQGALRPCGREHRRDHYLARQLLFPPPLCRRSARQAIGATPPTILGPAS